MILAAIGAVRGNFSALSDVISAIDDAGIEIIFCTGDLVAGGENGGQVIDQLIAREVICVQGIEDRRVLRARRKETSLRNRLGEDQADGYVRAHASLRSQQLEWLRGLPPRRALEIDQHPLTLCHGNLTSQSTPMEGDMPLFRFERQREIAPVDLIVCGGAETPFQRNVAGTLFVNPGPLSSEHGSLHWTEIDLEEHPYSAILRRCRG
jgi:predicted phosphodiesterase